MLGGDRRRPVPAGPSAGAQLLEALVLVGREPVRSFPPSLLAELGSEVRKASVRGGHLQGPSRPSLLARVVDVVVGGVDLGRPVPRVGPAAVVPPESPEVHLPHVELGTAARDPLSHHLAHAPSSGDAVRAEPGGDEEASDVGCAEDELAVRGEGLRAVDHPHDAGGLHRGDHAEAALGERLEPRPVRRKQLVVEAGRWALLVPGPRGRLALVAPGHEAAPGLRSEVHEAVGVTKRGKGRMDTVDGLRQQVLVGEGNDRDFHACHPPELVGEDPTRVHDDVRADRVPAVERHAAHQAVVDVDAGDPGAGQDPASSPPSPLGQCHRQAARVNVAIGGQMRRPQHPLRIEQGEALQGLLGRDDGKGKSERSPPARQALELLDPLRRGGQAERPHLVPPRVHAGLRLQSAVQLDRVHHHPCERHARPELSDQTRGVERGARGQVGTFCQHNVGPPQVRQVIGDAGAGDAAADDDRSRLVHVAHISIVQIPVAASSSQPRNPASRALSKHLARCRPA